jgi:two-component system, chemotaxis family, response regulator PixG
MNTKEEILAIFLMRYKLQPSYSLPLVDNWLRENPQENCETLKALLKQDKILVSGGLLQQVSQSKYKICCIDDSPTVLNQIDNFLEGYDCSVFLINNPISALREMIRIMPDVILMDINMPEIDGYKLCRLIKNHSKLKTKSVIMMTSNSGILDRAKARLVGATDYLTKPFSKSEFLEIVSKNLKNER